MQAREQAIEVYQVNHLPLVKAYGDKIGLVEVINQLVPSEAEVDAGTVVLALVIDTLSGRSPLYRLEEFYAHQDVELLLGRAVAPEALNDDLVGRVLDRIYETGTMKIFSECAVRACGVFEVERQHVHFDTTSRSVYGDYEPAEGGKEPFTITYGYSKDQRPDLKQLVLTTLCVERDVPIFGTVEDGNASDKRLNHEILTEISRLMARQGVETGSYIYIGDAAMVTEENLHEASRGLFITRLPASYQECGRVIQEAVEANQWQEVGVLAQTKPTKNRPAAQYQVTENQVKLYGESYRAVVVHSSAEDERRQKRIEREVKASQQALEAQVGAEAQRLYLCRPDAEAAAQRLSQIPSDYHQVQVQIEERPRYGPGRPSRRHPRPVKQMRYGLRAVINLREEVIQQKRQEAGCFVLLTNVPTQGELAHRGADVLRAYKEQHGVERNFGFLKDPLIVNRLFLKKEERIEALGLVLLLSLLIWRLMERSLRLWVERTGRSLTGWDKKPTTRPTAFMMTTKFAGVMVIKPGGQRQLARPLSSVQRAYLEALGVSVTYFIEPRAR